MKPVLFGLVGLLSFVGVFVGSLAATGNLNKAALDRALKREPAMTEAAGPGPATQAVSDTIGPLAQQLKKKEDALNEREKKLDEREAELAQREKDLEALRGQVETLQQEVKGEMNAQAGETQKKREAIALTIGEMKPDKAAERLKGLPTEDVAAILSGMKSKEAGKILEAMDAAEATRVFQLMQGSGSN